MKKILTILVIVLSLIFVSPVFADSDKVSPGVKPGSFFYFFDTTFENISLFFTFNSEKKVKKHLEYAEERLAEVEAVSDDNEPKAIAKAIKNYEENVLLATKESKEVEDEVKAEELFKSISDSNLKHQEILNSVLDKVPEEAKEAIRKAIEISKEQEEEAKKEISGLKREVEDLKTELEILKEEKQKAEEELKESKKEDGNSDMEFLRLEVEALKKQQETERLAEEKKASEEQKRIKEERLRAEAQKKLNLQRQEEERLVQEKSQEELDRLEVERLKSEEAFRLAEIQRKKEERIVENKRLKELAEKQSILDAIKLEEERVVQEKQDRVNLINALTYEYNQKVNLVNQQIVDTKTQYYEDLKDLRVSYAGRGVTSAGVAPLENTLLNTANEKISDLQLESERLRVYYQSQIDALNY